MGTASGACTTVTLSGAPRSSARTRDSSPTKMTRAFDSAAASSAPATISSGAWSPPMASMAIRGVARLFIERQPVFGVLHTAVVVFDARLRKRCLKFLTEALGVPFLLSAPVIEGDQAAAGSAELLERAPGCLPGRFAGYHNVTEDRRRLAFGDRNAADSGVFAGKEHLRAADAFGGREQRAGVGKLTIASAPQCKQTGDAGDRVGRRNDVQPLVRQTHDFRRGQRYVLVVDEEIHVVVNAFVHREQELANAGILGIGKDDFGAELASDARKAVARNQRDD